MAALVRRASRELRSLRRRPASQVAGLRAQAETARDLGRVAAESSQALQADLARVVVPSDPRADQPASGAHLFAVPAQARSAHRHSPWPARRRAGPSRLAGHAAAARDFCLEPPAQAPRAGRNLGGAHPAAGARYGARRLRAARHRARRGCLEPVARLAASEKRFTHGQTLRSRAPGRQPAGTDRCVSILPGDALPRAQGGGVLPLARGGAGAEAAGRDRARRRAAGTGDRRGHRIPSQRSRALRRRGGFHSDRRCAVAAPARGGAAPPAGHRLVRAGGSARGRTAGRPGCALPIDPRCPGSELTVDGRGEAIMTSSAGTPARPIAVLVEREGLGDVLLKLPLLRAIARGFPKTPIWWISTHQTDMAGPLRQSARRLREYPGFSLVFDTRSRIANVWLARHMLAHESFFCCLPGYFLSAARPPGRFTRPRHIGERALSLAQAALGEKADASGQLEATAGARQAAEAVLPDGPLYVGLGVGSRDPRKNWPIEKFAELSRRLCARDMAPVLLLGPREIDRAEAIRAAVPASASVDLTRSSAGSGSFDFTIAIAE